MKCTQVEARVTQVGMSCTQSEGIDTQVARIVHKPIRIEENVEKLKISTRISINNI
ncbi:MAG: hypothetical protein ACRCWQ_05085 [Bacilli bacterium]